MGILFDRELQLPVKGKSERVTRREIVAPGDYMMLFEENQDPGCILHWWLTTSIKEAEQFEPSRDMGIEIYYDEEKQPAVQTTLAVFFSILLGQSVFTTKVNHAALKVLPRNSYNCYFPIPFKSIQIKLINHSSMPCCIWFMASWQRYPGESGVTPLRLRLYHHISSPAHSMGSHLMADISGNGFIAGMVLGIQKKDNSDSWYHNGGDLWLLDGERSPRAMRGIGGEDVFNMSFGIYDVQTDWMGSPYIRKTDKDRDVGSGYEGIVYRIFGPDPVWFDSSAVLRFGTKANDHETLIYAYVEEGVPQEIITPAEWELAGPFLCNERKDFEKREWAEDNRDEWKDKIMPDFGQYLPPYHCQLADKSGEVMLPILEQSEHGWCDFAKHFRGRQKTNQGTQPNQVSAYAYGKVDIKEQGAYMLWMGYDDWIKLWINGKEVHRGEHDKGFAEDEVMVSLDQGEAEILVKLSNFDNVQWRLWSFTFRLEKQMMIANHT